MSQVKHDPLSADSDHHFLSESFDRRTLLDMEAALDRASKELPAGQHDHDIRTFIAERIIECVAKGAHSEDAMARAARNAVEEIAARRCKF